MLLDYRVGPKFIPVCCVIAMGASAIIARAQTNPSLFHARLDSFEVRNATWSETALSLASVYAQQHADDEKLNVVASHPRFKRDWSGEGAITLSLQDVSVGEILKVLPELHPVRVTTEGRTVFIDPVYGHDGEVRLEAWAAPEFLIDQFAGESTSVDLRPWLKEKGVFLASDAEAVLEVAERRVLVRTGYGNLRHVAAALLLEERLTNRGPERLASKKMEALEADQLVKYLQIKLDRFEVKNATWSEAAKELASAYARQFPDREGIYVQVLQPSGYYGRVTEATVTMSFRDATLGEIARAFSRLLQATVSIQGQGIGLDPGGANQGSELGMRILRGPACLVRKFQGEAQIVNIRPWLEEKGIIFAPEGKAILDVDQQLLIVANYARETWLISDVCALEDRLQGEGSK